MKIEDRAKRKSYQHFVGREGYGIKRAYAKPTAYAREQMHRKPYGGVYEQEHTDAGAQE